MLWSVTLTRLGAPICQAITKNIFYNAQSTFENAANIKDMQKRLGHAKIETTLDTYTHDTEQMSNESVNIFEKAAKK